MIIQLFEKRKEMKAKRKYKGNLNNINSLDNTCNKLDDLKREMRDMDCSYMSKHIEELGLIQEKMIEEMLFCEEENLNMCDKYEEREKIYESV